MGLLAVTLVTGEVDIVTDFIDEAVVLDVADNADDFRTTALSSPQLIRLPIGSRLGHILSANCLLIMATSWRPPGLTVSWSVKTRPRNSTVAIVDGNGVVTYMWVGKLPPLEEKGLMSKLSLQDTRPPDEWSITEAEFERKLANKEQLVLLDIRHRAAYAKNHKYAARNIPLDELPVRAQNELSPDQTIVVYGNDPSETDLAYSILESQGFAHVLLLVEDATPPAGQL
ncbi:MAG TPA: rhodanese-like domain-containing protein [Pyrinomonadaceae bacterium]|nr:rhodanese-like domain-containing protein [Pyrinomonadaceae bacterium]